ncbi:MAG: 6,7-dimethyl-8-ribityllumazine synthase [Bacteroides sp.]|nr:6,7-dimethyl-8-ribityllumazine synthase [Bacteroides sp.]
MSTILNTNGTSLQVPTIDDRAKGDFYIFTADWNPKITWSLRDAAIDVLKEGGIAENRIHSHAVAGTVELVNAAGAAMNTRNADGLPPAAVIIIGCVIRGDTPHFDYVCEIAAHGTAMLNAKGETPVIFGVLTVDNEQQAIDRAGGVLGNKGAEAAAAAITMANLHCALYPNR